MNIVTSKTQDPTRGRKHISARIPAAMFAIAFAMNVTRSTARTSGDALREPTQSPRVPAVKLQETGLEAGRPEVNSRPTLEPLEQLRTPAALGPPPMAPAKAATPNNIPRYPQERMGKLENYIRNNPTVRKAEQLRSDPRINALPPRMRADFLNEFGTLMFAEAVPSLDSLLERTRALDHDQMEMEDRIFKYRDAVVAFNMSSAALDAEIQEHNGKATAYAADLRRYESDLTGYRARLADFNARLNSHNAEAATHNAEVANYTAQCVGASLPPDAFARCRAWQQSLNSRAAVLNNRKAQLDAERTALAQEESGLSARRVALRVRADEINARKAELQSRMDAREKQRGELLAEEQKLKDWQTSIQPQWDFEIKHIDEWRALVDKFNERLEKALAGVKT